MTPLLSWAPLALYFMGSVAVASLIGLACTKAVRWMDAKRPDVLAALEFIFVWIVIVGIISSSLGGLIVVAGVGIVVAICGVGTFAERIVLPSRQSWADTFLRMLFTTACCVALSFFLMFVAFFSLPRSLGPGPVMWVVAGSAMGAFCSPSITPVFIWVWRSLEMRPGVDRPLELDERLQSKENRLFEEENQ